MTDWHKKVQAYKQRFDRYSTQIIRFKLQNFRDSLLGEAKAALEMILRERRRGGDASNCQLGTTFPGVHTECTMSSS